MERMDIKLARKALGLRVHGLFPKDENLIIRYDKECLKRPWNVSVLSRAFQTIATYQDSDLLRHHLPGYTVKQAKRNIFNDHFANNAS